MVAMVPHPVGTHRLVEHPVLLVVRQTQTGVRGHGSRHRGMIRGT